jgi:hypothetical protein
MFYIIFFTSCSFIFLLNLRYTFNYFYLNNVWIFDAFFLLIICYLFINNFFFFFIFYKFFFFLF